MSEESEEGDFIDCPEHGSSASTLVCQHLIAGQGLGFHVGIDPEAPDALWPDAWCADCEAVLLREGEWTDAAVAQADFRPLCSSCYQRVRRANWPSNDAEFGQLVETSVAYLQAQQKQLESRYQLGSCPRYDWYQESAELVFSRGGKPVVVADIQFVGSISTRSRSWLWSWGNQSLLESAKSRIREVRAFGDAHSFLKLASAYWEADEVDGWEMTAVSAFLLKAKGAYRSPDERGFTFLVMTDVRWAQ
ncbi:MAG TPA: hypothetical protein VIG29_14875 [Vicinamibacteria bacterium]|jgi:hypothetical protein